VDDGRSRQDNCSAENRLPDLPRYEVGPGGGDRRRRSVPNRRLMLCFSHASLTHPDSLRTMPASNIKDPGRFGAKPQLRKVAPRARKLTVLVTVCRATGEGGRRTLFLRASPRGRPFYFFFVQPYTPCRFSFLAAKATRRSRCDKTSSFSTAMVPCRLVCSFDARSILVEKTMICRHGPAGGFRRQNSGERAT